MIFVAGWQRRKTACDNSICR